MTLDGKKTTPSRAANAIYIAFGEQSASMSWDEFADYVQIEGATDAEEQATRLMLVSVSARVRGILHIRK